MKVMRQPGVMVEFTRHATFAQPMVKEDAVVTGTVFFRGDDVAGGKFGKDRVVR